MSDVKSAARLLVEVLIAQGVKRVFCVPGESFLSVLDALHDVRDRVETIVCRHEAAATNAAEATGKLTGRPGVAFVTRGPGATHGAVGVHTARQDSSPMILFIGQVARADRGREAFQEVDYGALFGSMTKWASEIGSADRVPELVERAFHVAMQGRMGPVALALPEDMLLDESTARVGKKIAPSRSGPDVVALGVIAGLLHDCKRPMAILGGSGWDEVGLGAMQRFLSGCNIPTALSFRRKHLIDNDSAIYVGDLGLGPNPELLARIREADLVLAVGARLGENPTQGYSLFTREDTARKLIHIHPDADEIGRVWPVRIGMACDLNLAAQALELIKVDGWPRQGWRETARAEYEAFATPIAASGAVNLSEVFAHLNEALPEDAIIANDAGNFAAWLHRFIRHRQFNTQVGPSSGAMGYGLPAAMAAKLEFPERIVLAVAGDGGFLMSGNELATCMRHGVNVIALVIDNGSYGTIRMHQERAHPGRVHGTGLCNPDFVAFAEAFGVHAQRVERSADFPAALQAARDANKPALIHIVTDVDDIAPGKRIAAKGGLH